MKCKVCKKTAQVALPSHHAGFCPDCFKTFYGRQVAKAIKSQSLFTHDERILVALSGGKDSLALMHQLNALGYDVTGLHIALGIPESSDAVQKQVEDFCDMHDLKLMIINTPEHGLAIPDVKAKIRRPVCSVCGKIKRYFFNKAAIDGNFDAIATGHNLDDEVARLFSNTTRWDQAYLADQGPRLDASGGFARKVKPLFRVTEFENACYAFFHGINHHKAPCPYSEGASFTAHKQVWESIERRSPGSKFQFYDGFLKRGRPAFAALEEQTGDPVTPCTKCGYPTSAELCGVCRIREQLK